MFKEEDLRKFNLLTLREFARKIGVKSPTSKKKAQLIKEIVNIEKGLQKPYFSKFGRKPSKSIANEDFDKCNYCTNKVVVNVYDIPSTEFALILKNNINNLLNIF